MKNCHVCNFECEDNAELCPVCGADLSAVSENGALDSSEGIEPVLLTTFEDVVSAEIFKDVLTDNKIPYSGSQNAMKVVFGGGFAAEEIYVDKKDYETAQGLLEEFLASEAEFAGDFFDETDEEQ